MEKDFLYYLVDNQGRSYYEDVNGNVTVISIPQDLNYTPDGWMDKSVAYGRSIKFPGILRTFTVPLKFTMDGARILKYLYYTYGIQAEGNLVILKRDITTGTEVFKRYYVGAMDFSQFAHADRTVQCNVMEAGLTALIKANEGTKYDIPISVPEAVPVVMDGITLYSNVNVVNYADIFYDDSGNQGINVRFDTDIFFGNAVVDTETKYPSVLFATSTAYKGAESLDYDPNDWLMQADKNATLKISGRMQFKIAGSDGYRIGAYIRKGNIARIADLVPFTAVTGVPHDIDVSFDVNIPITQGEKVWLFVNNTGGGAGKIIAFDHDNKITVVYDFRKEESTVMCLRPLYVFQQLISKITKGKYTATSTLLSGDAANTVLTCGDALRGFIAGTPSDYNGPVLKTSLNDFIKSYNVPYNIGLGSQDTAIVERKDVFFNNTLVVDLGEVAKLNVDPATDHLFNTVTIGWPDQNYEDVNGRNEFNTTQVYTTPVTRIVKDLDLTSTYRADPYGIEFARINLDNKTTTDNQSDNDVFMVNINNALRLDRPAYTSLTGVATPTVFNVELSPKTCLIAHGNYLHVGLDKLDTEYLEFQTTTKAYNLSRTLAGVTITEKANYLIGALAKPLFLPQVFTFDTEVPINLVDLVEANPYGKVKFTWSNDIYYGYILEASQQPAMNAKQTFKLLASADNDMTKLIYA